MIRLKDPTLFKERGFIASQWVAADSGQTAEIRNPASGEVLGAVPHMGAAETRRAIEAADKLAATVTAEAAAAIPWVQPVMAAPYFAHAQFSDPATILALPWPGEGLPYVRAMWHYARGIAHLGRGDMAAARAEAAAIATIAAGADFQSLTAGGVPADAVLAIARLVVEARIAQAEGRAADAIALLQSLSMNAGPAALAAAVSVAGAVPVHHLRSRTADEAAVGIGSLSDRLRIDLDPIDV